jgi:hypothetical protein
VDVKEFHAAYLFELFFYPAARFQGVVEAALHGLFWVFLVGIKKLQETGNGMADGDGVALVDIAAKG